MHFIQRKFELRRYFFFAKTRRKDEKTEKTEKTENKEIYRYCICLLHIYNVRGTQIK